MPLTCGTGCSRARLARNPRRVVSECFSACCVHRRQPAQLRAQLLQSAQPTIHGTQVRRSVVRAAGRGLAAGSQLHGLCSAGSPFFASLCALQTSATTCIYPNEVAIPPASVLGDPWLARVCAARSASAGTIVRLVPYTLPVCSPARAGGRGAAVPYTPPLIGNTHQPEALHVSRFAV